MSTRRATAHALFVVCAVLDFIPWRENGRWYLHGCRGCAWGLSRYAISLGWGDQ